MSIAKNFLDDLLFLKYRLSYNFNSRFISYVAENVCCQFFKEKVVQKNKFSENQGFVFFKKIVRTACLLVLL